MTSLKNSTLAILGALGLAACNDGVVPTAPSATLAATAQHQAGGAGRMGGMVHQADHQADMQLLHTLLENRERITRTVGRLPNGVDTLTESDDPTIAKTLQAHVASMSARVSEARPIHQRDPLFREIFAHADRIVMRHENTRRGVRVIETSDDPYVVRLIQAHADVVTAFLANGHAEAMKNHPVPDRPR